MCHDHAAFETESAETLRLGASRLRPAAEYYRALGGITHAAERSTPRLEPFATVRPLLSDFRHRMENSVRAIQSGRILSRDRLEAVLSRIRAEARACGYDIVLVKLLDETAGLMLMPSSATFVRLDVCRTVEPVSLEDHLHRVETDMIRWALRAAQGNTTRAARLLKMKRSTLHDRITRCGLRRTDDR